MQSSVKPREAVGWPAAVVGTLLLALVGCADKERPAPTTAPAKTGAAAKAAEPRGHENLPGKGSVSAPFDISGVIRRVHFSYREEDGRFTGGHATYAVEVKDGRVKLRPFHHPDVTGERELADPRDPMSRSHEPPELGKVVEGAPLEIETVSVARGEARAWPVVGSKVDSEDGSLRIDRGSVIERLRNGEDGVEQSWEIAEKPAGEGDLVVRVRVAGLRFVGETEQGLHFRDPKSGLGFRYGRATWVGADGKREELGKARFANGEIAMAVPAAVLERTRFPAVLDPVIGPEIAMDEPVQALALGAQMDPAVASDGSSYLAVWTDARRGLDADIFGARVSSTGMVLDPFGIPISIAPNDQAKPSVAWNGTNYMAVWADNRNGVVEIRGTQVSSGGTVASPGGIRIGFSTGAARAPAVAWNGTNYLVVWHEDRDGQYDVYGALLSATGEVSGAPIAIATGLGNQSSPSAASDGTSFLVVWTRNGVNISGARVSGVGVVLDSTEIAISSADGTQRYPKIAWGSTSYLVVWEDNRSRSNDVYGARLDGAGAVLDPLGIPISTAIGAQTRPAVAWTGASFLATWEDRRNHGYDIFGSRVGQDGAVVDGAGFAVCEGDYYKSSPAIASGAGGSFVVWRDARSLGWDIYGAQVSGSGEVLSTESIAVSTSADSELEQALASDGTDFLVAWMDLKGVRSDIFAVRVSGQGVVLDPTGIEISSPVHYNFAPSVAWAGRHYVVVWDGSLDLYGMRVGADGAKLDPAAIAISMDVGGNPEPAVASDGSGSSLVVWKDDRSGTSADIYGARMSADGQVLDGNGFAISEAVGDQLLPKLAWDGSAYLVVWEDRRNGVDADVYGARVGVDATVLDAAGIAISSASGDQSAPSVASDGTSHLVVWEDLRSGGEKDIYGARVSASGSVIDVAGIAVSTAENNQIIPSVAWDGTRYLVAWEDRRSDGGPGIWETPVRRDGMVEISGGELFEAGGRFPYVGSNAVGRSLVTYLRFSEPEESLRVFGRLYVSLADGAACFEALECASGFCVDGVCCNEACGAGEPDCQACSVAAGASSDGICGLLLTGTICRVSSGSCDAAESCDGVSRGCPLDQKQPPSFVCREPAGGCDLVERCDGTDDCPPDLLMGSGTVCRDFVGECDFAEACDGVSEQCPPDARMAPGTVCREAAGECDLAESCDGIVGRCPADSVMALETVCRAAAGACDVAEACDGRTKGCPADVRVAQGTVCRAASGACDRAEACSGEQAECPDDAVKASGSVCRPAAGTCDLAEACDGNERSCPADAFAAQGTECAAASCAAGIQSPAAFCPGTGADCLVTSVPCNGYLCAGNECATACSEQTGCAPDHWCDPSSLCLPKLALAAECSSDDACGSGHCADGVCCDTSCTGQCEACDLASAVGTCSPISGPPHGARDACVTDGSACGGSCDGVLTQVCVYPGATVSCRAAGCAGGVVSAEASCIGTGACPDSTVAICQELLCAGDRCALGCVSHDDCAAGYFCAAGTCTAKLSLGESCGGDHACVSGHCADGVCCDDACLGQCEACGSDGRCANVVGAPRGTRPPCAGPSGSACVGRCDGTREDVCAYPGATVLCRAASCADAIATAEAFCDGQGGCPDARTQACAPYVCGGTACDGDCSVESDCASSHFCSAGVCVAKLELGEACGAASECASNQCVDGVCCDRACAGQCEACDLAASAGTCAPVSGAPHGARTASASDGSFCAGACDGQRADACSYPTATCRGASCSEEIATLAASCDGQGSCPGIQTVACAPYLCGPDACAGDCASHDDCVADHFCAAGVCRPQLELGVECAEARQCASGLCVDGVCCNRACEGQCEACDVAGADGTCSPVDGSPRGGRAACAGSGVCHGRCDGTIAGRCDYPGSTIECSPATCAEGTARMASTCDGAGQCAEGEETSCGAYVCGLAKCLAACTTRDDCVSGGRCESGVCVPPLPAGAVAQQPCGCASTGSGPMTGVVALLLGLGLRRRRAAAAGD